MNLFFNFHNCISNANIPCPKTGPQKHLKYPMVNKIVSWPLSLSQNSVADDFFATLL